MLGLGDWLLRFNNRTAGAAGDGVGRTDLYRDVTLSTIGFWTSNGGYYHSVRQRLADGRLELRGGAAEGQGQARRAGRAVRALAVRLVVGTRRTAGTGPTWRAAAAG